MDPCYYRNPTHSGVVEEIMLIRRDLESNLMIDFGGLYVMKVNEVNKKKSFSTE